MSNPTEEDMVKSLLPYAWKLAMKMFNKTPPWVSFEELYAETQFGALKAVRNHDASTGAALNTYAYVRMWGAMQDYLRVSQQGWTKHSGKVASLVSMDSDVGDQTYHELIPCDSIPPCTVVEHQEEAARMMGMLPAAHQRILRLRLHDQWTLKEIAHDLGFEESRASQIFQNMYGFLRGDETVLTQFGKRQKKKVA